MKSMKQLWNISSNPYFYMLLGFLFLANFSIAACYILFTLLLIILIGSWLNSLRKSSPVQEESGTESRFPRMPGYFKFFLLFIAASTLSTLFAIDRMNSLKDNKEFFIFLLIPLYILVLNNKKRLRLSLYTILASALLSSLIGIVITLKEGVSLDHRLQGFTSHWMTYSGLLMFPFIFFFIYLFYQKKKKERIIIGVTLVPILASILLSLTRSVWVGIFAALGIFLVYYKPKILYAAIPLLIIIVLVMPASVKNRVTSIVDMQNATNKDRFYMAVIAFDIFKDHPITGVGPNNIEKVYDKYKPAEAEQTNLHLHNNFLHILAERGILALLIMTAAFIAVIVSLVKRIRGSDGLEKTVSVGVLFVFVGFLVAGLFEYNFGDSEIKFLLFYFISIPFLCLPKDAPAEHRQIIGDGNDQIKANG